MNTQQLQELKSRIGRAVQDEQEAINTYNHILAIVAFRDPKMSTIARILIAALEDEKRHGRDLLYALELLQRERY